MWRYKIRAIVLSGFVCVCVLSIAPVRAQETDLAHEANTETVEAVEQIQPTKPADPKAATTTENIDIPIDELRVLIKPLTLEELQNEAAAWMLVTQAKSKEIAQAEIAIKRQNQAISQQKEGADALEKAKKALEDAEKTQKAATPGSPEYQQATKKVEEAQENLQKAQEAIKIAQQTKTELKQDETLKEALEKAKKTESLETAKKTLDEIKAKRDQTVAGDIAYEEATQKIDKLEAAIKAVEKAQEVQKGINPDSPEYQTATEELEKADVALKQLLQELGVESGTTEQSSQHLNTVTNEIKTTEINRSDEAKVAGLPGVVNSEENLQQKQQQLEQTKEKLEESTEVESEAKNQLVSTVTQLQSQLTAIVDRFNVILTELENKGGDAKSYQQYIQAVTAVELDAKDTEGLGLRLLGWAKSDEGGLRWANNTGKFLGVFIASIVVAQILGVLCNQILSVVGGTSAMMRHFIVLCVKRGGIIVGFLLALTALEVSLGPVLALVGGVSFVLAFALQSNLGNLASGLMIMFYKPFDVGDEIKFGELWGWVDSITLANTKIKGFDGQIFTVPNDTIWSDTIENLSHSASRQFTLWFRIGFDEDLVRVEQLLIEIMQSHLQVLTEPAPRTQVWSIEDYYISVKAAGWIKKEDFWTVHSDIIRRIRERFEKEGIKLAAIPKSIEIEGSEDDISQIRHVNDISQVPSVMELRDDVVLQE
jgi:small conductance mechanosensitive channel